MARPIPGSYESANQLTTNGYINFDLYSAQTLDSGMHSKSGKVNSGMELSTFRDMGNLGKHFSWRLFVGASVNDIQASTSFNVKAAVTTVTDTYDLFGQTPPAAPYSAPSTTTQNVVDSGGTQVTDVNGNPVTQTVDTTTLLGDVPLNRAVIVETDAISVLEQFKLHGAYATLRGGPTLIYNITDHLHFSVSAGPALIFSGSDYFVNAVLTPATGADIIDTIQSYEGKLLFGYYGDATLQYDLTDRTGFYVGAFFKMRAAMSRRPLRHRRNLLELRQFGECDRWLIYDQGGFQRPGGCADRVELQVLSRTAPGDLQAGAVARGLVACRL